MASIYSQGDRLYLTATLPRKDGTGRKQYKIPLHLPDTTQGRRKAQVSKKLLERSLGNGSFDWADWQPERNSKRLSWRDAIQRLYEWRRRTKAMTDKHWEAQYLPNLTKAPIKLGNPCTAADIAAVLATWDRSQQQYEKAHRAFSKLAELAEIPFPEVDSPTYQLPHQRGELKNVPTDPEIIDWVLGADRGQRNGKVLRWYWGMIATYGLRPEEVDHVTILEDDALQVPFVNAQGKRTKTGFRTVIPVPADWVELFDLRNRIERPNLNRECHRWLRDNLRRGPLAEKGWTSYSLRHAFAGRLWSAGGHRLDIYTAARLMGHSIEVHTRTYRAFIQPHTLAQQARAAIAANQIDQQEQQERLRMAIQQPYQS